MACSIVRSFKKRRSMKENRQGLGALAFILVIFFSGTGFCQENFSNLPVKGMVTMIDLGAKKCIPCKMMAPVMKKMEAAYKGKAVIVFIDVWENRDQARRFHLRAIPTQIFFNDKGKEVFRHVGFYNGQSIASQLAKMGVKSPDLNQ